jgi:hypothetical protein
MVDGQATDFIPEIGLPLGPYLEMGRKPDNHKQLFPAARTLSGK